MVSTITNSNHALYTSTFNQLRGFSIIIIVPPTNPPPPPPSFEYEPKVMGLSGGHKYKENNVKGGEREEGYITRVIDKGEGNRDFE